MSRRLIVMALIAICAVALSAISASGAIAGTTAFTCVKEGAAGPSKFSDDHCQSVDAKGIWGHEAFSEPTRLTLTSLANPVFVYDIGGIPLEITATGVECVNCTIENKEVENAKHEKVMEAVGVGGTLTFTGVKAPAVDSKCEVFGTKSETVTTKPLKFTTTSAAGWTLEPVLPPLFAEFKLKSRPGKMCVSIFELNLTILGQVATTLNGATMTINVTQASGELESEGGKVALKAEATVSASKFESEIRHPIGLTAATP